MIQSGNKFAEKHSFRYILSFTQPLTALGCSFEVLHHGVVVDSAQDLLLHQTKLFSRGQLPLTRVAGKTCQVVCVPPCTPHPVAGVYLPPAAGTLSTKPTVRGIRTEQQNEELWVKKKGKRSNCCRTENETYTVTSFSLRIFS